MHPNSYKLIQACDWLTALLPTRVKCEVQTASHQKKSLKMAGVLHAQHTSHEVETAKAEGTGKAVLLHAGMYNCDFCCITLL
jgi:hypothetical protein